MMTSINPDAHNLDMLDDIVHGVNIARKAGFGAAQVLNTQSAKEIAKTFSQNASN